MMKGFALNFASYVYMSPFQFLSIEDKNSTWGSENVTNKINTRFSNFVTIIPTRLKFNVAEFSWSWIHRTIRLTQCCTQIKPFGNTTFFVSGISISFKCECNIIMQIQYTEKLNPGRFELGTTLI